MSANENAHFAAQVASAAATTHLPPDPGFQHTNLGWSDEAGGVLVGRPVAGLRAGLRLGDLSWVVLDAGGGIRARLAAAGRTLAGGMAWLGDVLSEHGVEPARLQTSSYELPDHPLGRGAPLSADDPAGLAALAEGFRAAHAHVSAAVAGRGASEVRVWPHHFDLASLIPLESGDPEHARSVNVGWSPVPGPVGAPYFYVTPWPTPTTWAGPALPAGRWTTRDDGFFAAVLPAGAGDVPGFLAAAIAGAEAIAGR